MMNNNDSFTIAVIFFVSLFLLGYIYGKKGLEFRNIITWGLLFRLFLLFADYYDWFKILNSGTDSEFFHNVSVKNVLNHELYRKTNYTVFLTYLYRITDFSRLTAQFINVLFGMGIIFIMQHLMRCLEVSRKNLKYATIILSFLPNICIFSAILLREAWIEFFVAVSLLAFVHWFMRGGAWNVVISILSVLTAAYMHAGVIVIAIGYIVAYIVYDPNTKSITISRNTIISLVFLFAVGSMSSAYMGLFTVKFQEYDSVEDIVAVTNKTNGGGSDYLTWVNTNSVAQSLFFAPLKMVYFLFSPLPTEWRGVKDVLGFLIDGGIYLFMFYCMYKYKAEGTRNVALKRFLLINLLIVTFVFGYGTTNAGTAFRHRAKLIPLITLAFALSSMVSKEETYEENNIDLPESEDVAT